MGESIWPKMTHGFIALAICPLILTGCATSDTEPVAPVPTKIASSPEITNTSLPVEEGIVGTNTGLDCSALISNEDLYSYNPSYSLDLSVSPQSGSLAKLATDYKGISCVYINLSSGDSFTISLAKFEQSTFEEFKQKREVGSSKITSEAIPDSFTGLFTTGTNGGTLEVLGNGYWLTATAAWAQTPDDLLKPLGNALTKLN